MTASTAKPLRAGSYMLGFAFAGFFDGILLHQILQWHHLLSSFEAGALADLRVQVLADGLFHALMYVIAVIGLWLLWRGRRAQAVQADHFFPGCFLIGFGVWHLLDGILFHWILGLHRIRPGSDNVLLWDLVFFGLGLACVAAGWRLKGKSIERLPLALLACAVGVSGAISAIPPPGNQAVTVVFASGTTPEAVLRAADAVEARLMWNSRRGDVWVLYVPDIYQSWKLYRHGARFVGGSFFGVGCFTSAPRTV